MAERHSLVVADDGTVYVSMVRITTDVDDDGVEHSPLAPTILQPFRPLFCGIGQGASRGRSALAEPSKRLEV